MASQFIFPVLLILLTSCFSNCQSQLRAEYSSAVLPIGDYCHRLYYDGDDSIFILGGCPNTDNQRSLLKYSIQNDRILRAGTLAEDLAQGSVQTDGVGNLYLFGAGSSASTRFGVMKHDLAANASSIAINLPMSIHAQPSLPLNSTTVLILGSHSNLNKIWIFDLSSLTTSEAVARLPIDMYAGAGIVVGNRAFAFPYSVQSRGHVWELDLKNLEMTAVGPPTFPLLNAVPSPVTDGSLVYIVTGFDVYQNPPVASQEGILTFDPSTNSTRFIPVQNWPVVDGQNYFDTAPQCAFVPKLSRIYCFGGYASNVESPGGRALNTIFFVDLNPTHLLENTF